MNHLKVCYLSFTVLYGFSPNSVERIDDMAGIAYVHQHIRQNDEPMRRKEPGTDYVDRM